MTDVPAMHDAPLPKIAVRGLHAWYGDHRALDGVSLDISDGQVTAVIGASGCGKSTLLRCLNRMVETTRGGRMSGSIAIDGVEVGARSKVQRLRRRFGAIAQKPNPFPRSVYENVAYGIRLHDLAKDADDIRARVRVVLMEVGLWDEVSAALDEPAHSLSLGQQQRLCIARALAYRPEMMLFDEPCAALDPIAGERIEALILSLKRRLTVVLVTHRVELARRVADRAAFMHEGRVVEAGPADRILWNPNEPLTREFIASVDRSVETAEPPRSA